MSNTNSNTSISATFDSSPMAVSQSNNSGSKYIGKRVAKLFDDEQGEPLGLFRGIVMKCITVDDKELCLVTYDDGDSDNVDMQELKTMIALFVEVGEEIKFKSKKAYRHEVHRRARDYYFQIMMDQDDSVDHIPISVKSKLWNIKVRTNVFCHLCNAMKPLGAIFPCNTTYHSYCEHHLKTRLGVDLSPTKSNEPIKHIQYCPICCFTCSCTVCSRRLDISACSLEDCNLKKRPFDIKDWTHVQDWDPSKKLKNDNQQHVSAHADLKNAAQDNMQDNKFVDKTIFTHDCLANMSSAEASRKINELPNNQLNLLTKVIDFNMAIPQNTSTQILTANEIKLSSAISHEPTNQNPTQLATKHNEVTKPIQLSINEEKLSHETINSTEPSTSDKTVTSFSGHASKSSIANEIIAKESKDHSFIVPVRNCLDKQYNAVYKGRKPGWKYDTRCHLCHARRDKVLVFNCSIHFYCMKHLQERFNIKSKDILGNDPPTCPLCTLYCDCASCSRNFAHLIDYVRTNPSLKNADDNELHDFLMKSPLYPKSLKEGGDQPVQRGRKSWKDGSKAKHNVMNDAEISNAVTTCLQTQFLKINKNNSNRLVHEGAYCHLCQEVGTINGIHFSCGNYQHSYCLKHIQQAFNIKESDVIAASSEQNSLLPSNTCCPICVLTCTCVKCSPKLMILINLTKKKRPPKNATNKWFHNILCQSSDYPTSIKTLNNENNLLESANNSSPSAAIKSPLFTEWLSPTPTNTQIRRQSVPSQSTSTKITAHVTDESSNPSRFTNYNKKCKEFEDDFFHNLSNINLPSLAILSSFVCQNLDGQKCRQFYKFLRCTMGSSESVFTFTLCFYGVFYKLLKNEDVHQLHNDYFDCLGICLSYQNIVDSDGFLIRNFFKDVKRAISDAFQVDNPPTFESMDRNMDSWISTIFNYEYRFFDDLTSYGTDSIIFLASSTTYADGSYMRRFYGLLRGEKSDTKYAIMNQCLCTVLIRWIKYDNGKPCMDFTTFWEICLILSSCFMSYGIQYSILRDFFNTKAGSFGLLVQQTYQRYHQGGFIKSTSVPYKYSILEHNKKQSSLELNDDFIKRHKLQIEQTFTSSIPKSPTPSTMDEVAEIISLRRQNVELSSKVTTLESEVSQLKASNSSLRAQLSMEDKQREI